MNFRDKGCYLKRLHRRYTWNLSIKSDTWSDHSTLDYGPLITQTLWVSRHWLISHTLDLIGPYAVQEINLVLDIYTFINSYILPFPSPVWKSIFAWLMFLIFIAFNSLNRKFSLLLTVVKSEAFSHLIYFRVKTFIFDYLTTSILFKIVANSVL